MPKELALVHPCGLQIGKDLSALEVKAIDGVQSRDMGTGYIWYRLPQAEIAGQAIAMSLCFFRGRLEHLSLVVVNSELYGASWDDWSAEKERAAAAATGQWLARVGYPVGSYPWGTVYAETDPKTGDGGGGIALARPGSSNQLRSTSPK